MTNEIKYGKRGDRYNVAQEFDKEKITIKIKGQNINVYDMIQEGREDTEIYPTLEKYGSLKRMEADIEAVYGDFTEIKELKDLIKAGEKAQELWNNLPLEMRNEFGNNSDEFMKNGENWLKKKINEQNEFHRKEENLKAEEFKLQQQTIDKKTGEIENA